MIYKNSPVACYLYELHENTDITINEKIEKIVVKYEKLNKIKSWDSLYKFFLNPIFTKTSYYCKTYSNFGNGTIENRYIYTDVSHENAVRGNIYFYLLLSVIGGDNDIVAYTANYLTYSEKTSKYLYEYGKENNLQFESSGREGGKYLIRMMSRCVLLTNGYSIYKCIELPI